MEKGLLFNIQHFSIHDGPGIRSTVFFKGCNLRCWWCHNPESWEGRCSMQFFPRKCIGCGACAEVCPNAFDGHSAILTDKCTACGLCAENCYAEASVRTGKRRDTDDVLEELCRDKSAYARSGGGVTCSGGEPLLQAAFLRELLSGLRREGIHTAMESALCVPWETLRSVLPLIDLVMCDIKCIDPQLHKSGTGVTNERILENIQKMCASGVRPILRTPVIPGFNDNAEEIDKIGSFVSALPGQPELELLPFHGICVGKYESMGMEYRGKGLETPSHEKMESLADAARKHGVSVTCK